MINQEYTPEVTKLNFVQMILTLNNDGGEGGGDEILNLISNILEIILQKEDDWKHIRVLSYV